MSQLRQHDFHAIMEIVEQLYSYQTLDACEAGIVESLQRAMDCDSWHLSESDPKQRRVRWTSDWASRRPETIPNPNEVVARYMHEHPFLRRWNSRREDFKPVTLSDLISRPSWHDTGLYNEIYRPIRIEHMLGVALPGLRPHAVHVVGLRGTIDFDDRDRRMLDLLAPHLAAVYRNAFPDPLLAAQAKIIASETANTVTTRRSNYSAPGATRGTIRSNGWSGMPACSRLPAARRRC